MAAAYESTKGDMAERLLAALDAGQSKGGDSRGMQSGGILVVRPPQDPNTQVDREVEIRVDDAENPFKELHRILNVRKSGTHSTRATALAKEGKLADAIAEQRIALDMNPMNEQLNYGLAVLYAQAGEYVNSLNALTLAIKKQPRLRADAFEEPSFGTIKDMPEFKRLLGQ